MAMAASPAASRPATPDLRHGGSVIGGRRAGRGVLGHRARRTDRTARPSDRAVGAQRGDRRGDRPPPRKPGLPAGTRPAPGAPFTQPTLTPVARYTSKPDETTRE